jgi:hypothetical protein
VQLCLKCYTKEAGVLWSSAYLAHVELCGAETCPPPPSKATRDSLYMQLPRSMNLDSEHSPTVQSGNCGYGTVYVNIVLYFPSSNTVFWNTPQMVYLRSIDCCYFLGQLTTPWNKKLSRAFITPSWALSLTVQKFF